MAQIFQKSLCRKSPKIFVRPTVPLACQVFQILLFTFQTFPCSLMKSFTGTQGVCSVWTAPFYVPNIEGEQRPSLELAPTVHLTEYTQPFFCSSHCPKKRITLSCCIVSTECECTPLRKFRVCHIANSIGFGTFSACYQ